MDDSFVLNKAWCCALLQGAIEDAGTRGMSVVICKTALGILFSLQSRSIAFADEDKVKEMHDGPRIFINISTDEGFKYCPWCGKLLEELVKAAPEFFNDLATRHEKFQPEGRVI